MAEDAASRPNNSTHSGGDMLAVLAAVDNDNGGLESVVAPTRVCACALPQTA